MMSKPTTTSVKRRLAAAMLLLSGFMANTANADFINTDFSNGFDNWQGEVLGFDYTAAPGLEDFADVGDITATYPDNFTLSGPAATVTTTADATSDYYSIVMFQDAFLDILAPNESLWLSLGVSTSLTSAVDDFFFVQLRNLATDDVVDLSAGGSFDITAFTGNNVTFEFGVQDNDFVLGDALTVSNISFDVTATDVSAPAGTLLAALGLGMMAWRRAKSSVSITR